MSQARRVTLPAGRLAPSPTGRLHLGHARSFLLAYWHVRNRRGRLVLRLEDLDGPRVSPELCDAVLEDLEWLGLDWDGTPRRQSAHPERYRAALERLHRSGRSYPCVCTRGDIRTAQSAPQQGDQELRYPGRCRDRFATLGEARQIRQPGIRFRVVPGEVTVRDGFAGTHRFDVDADVGDFLIARRDGSPAYQLAVVVDDDDDGINEVLRGDDLLPSAARQSQLQAALGLTSPTWFHVPLVVDATGRRLAKRADDLSLAALRAGGTDPRAIVAWVAHTAGIPTDARVHPTECIEAFSLARVPRAPVVLGPGTMAELATAR